MAIKYNPKDAVMVLPAGEYNAVLEKYEEKVSKKGNDMMVLTWKVFQVTNDQPLVTDYVVLPSFTFKLKKLAKALGRLKDFEAGTFQPEDYVGSSARVHLDVEHQEGFDERNAIGSYIALADDAAPAGKFAPTSEKDKDIPF